MIQLRRSHLLRSNRQYKSWLEGITRSSQVSILAASKLKKWKTLLWGESHRAPCSSRRVAAHYVPERQCWLHQVPKCEQPHQVPEWQQPREFIPQNWIQTALQFRYSTSTAKGEERLATAPGGNRPWHHPYGAIWYNAGVLRFKKASELFWFRRQLGCLGSMWSYKYKAKSAMENPEVWKIQEHGSSEASCKDWGEQV